MLRETTPTTDNIHQPGTDRHIQSVFTRYTVWRTRVYIVGYVSCIYHAATWVVKNIQLLGDPNPPLGAPCFRLLETSAEGMSRI